MATPQIDETIAADLLAQAQQEALNVSRGRLTDVSAASPLTAILEAVALVGSTVQNEVNQLAQNIEDNRIAAFGIDRTEGVAATLTVEVRLQATYAEPFLLPSGYRFAVGGVPFETTEDAAIAAYGESVRVSATALVTGVEGNVKVGAAVAFTAVDRMSGIFLIEDAKGGTDAEEDEEWRSKIYNVVRRRDTLISLPDFQDYAIEYLGNDSVAVAVSRLKPDRATYDNGYVGVFALNPDGSELTQSQIAALQDEMTELAAMASVTVWSVEQFDITVDVVVTLEDATDPSAIATTINNLITNFMKAGTLPPGELILNKEIEYIVQTVVGVKRGALSVELNGLAAPAALPNNWTIARLSSLKVTTINSSGVQNSFDF